MENEIKVRLGVMVVKGNKVLLGKRVSDNTWTLPGGLFEVNETLENAAKSEVMKKTGLFLNKVRVLSVNNDIFDNKHYITIGFYSEDFEGEPNEMDKSKILQWKWFDIFELPSPLFFPARKIFECYNQKKWYIE